MRFDITIPVLDEEERLESGVIGLRDFMDSSTSIRDYTITIADNGSVDDTWDIARSLADRYPQVKRLQVDRRGVGLALKRSWGQADADIIGYMDVDLATDLRHIVEVHDAMKDPNISIVNASRLLAGSEVVGRSLTRNCTSIGFNMLLKFILGTSFSDGMCGFKFLRRSVYECLAAKGVENDGWFFCTELLVKAEWAGYVIRELPVSWQDGGDSRVHIPKLASAYLKEILKLRYAGPPKA